MAQAHGTKEALWEFAWQLLLRAKNDRKHPFRTPVFCTVSPTLHPRSRTLVLRNVLRDEARLWCYTDRRSQKAVDISTNPKVAWTFWSPKQQLQVNVAGTAAWLNEGRANQFFKSMPKHGRKAYATLSAPGSPQQELTSGLPDNWEDIDIEATKYAAAYFGVLVTQMERLEVLQLSRSGHQRLLGTRGHGGNWTLDWLTP